MTKVIAIAKKELRSYFSSPIAYIILLGTLSLFNIFFFMIVDQNKEVSLVEIFQVMEFMFVLLIPLLTMGLLAEEKSAGTMEFLMTAPLSNTSIVLGKYLGVLCFFSLLLSLTMPYYFVIEYFGSPDRATIRTGYLGIFLEGALFIAIGLMASSWTSNQIISAMVSFVLLLLLYSADNFSPYFSGSMQSIISQLSTRNHLDHFVRGIIAPADIMYFVSGIIVCLTLTRLGIENRLWR
jgi:ABC-2 type transport system permease protein